MISGLFRKYDVDRDGYLRREDLVAFADALANDLLPPDEIKRRRALADAYGELWTQLSAIADIDRNGHIGEQEFIAATGRGGLEHHPGFRAATARAIEAITDAVDLNGDGFVSAAEYRRIFDTEIDEPLTRAAFASHAQQLFPLSGSDAADHNGQWGIALVAHDTRKPDLLEWTSKHREILIRHRLYGTGTTSGLITGELGLPVTTFLSGPLGGDQQIGSRIAEGEIDLLIFFWDPLAAQPHDHDVKALIRLAVMTNVPIACNTATADLIMAAPVIAGMARPA